MGKKQICATILVSVFAFSAGFLLRPVWDKSSMVSIQTGSGTEQNYQSGNSSSPSPGQLLSQEADVSSDETCQKENTIPADSIQVRIDDGQVQWYDGTVWHTVAAVEELAGKDKFYLALESFEAFSQELRQEKADNPPQFGSDDAFMNGNDLSVGKKETPKPTPKPATTPPPAVDESAPQTPPAEDTAPVAPGNPVPGTPPAPSNPTPPPSEPTAPSNGDGEDIDADDALWSGLVL